MATVYNSTDGPVVIDDEGRTLGGREHGDVSPSDPRIEAALEAGVLVRVDEEKKPSKSTRSSADKEA